MTVFLSYLGKNSSKLYAYKMFHIITDAAVTVVEKKKKIAKILEN